MKTISVNIFSEFDKVKKSTVAEGTHAISIMLL